MTPEERAEALVGLVDVGAAREEIAEAMAETIRDAEAEATKRERGAGRWRWSAFAGVDRFEAMALLGGAGIIVGTGIVVSVGVGVLVGGLLLFAAGAAGAYVVSRRGQRR